MNLVKVIAGANCVVILFDPPLVVCRSHEGGSYTGAGHCGGPVHGGGRDWRQHLRCLLLLRHHDVHCDGLLR